MSESVVTSLTATSLPAADRVPANVAHARSPGIPRAG